MKSIALSTLHSPARQRFALGAVVIFALTACAPQREAAEPPAPAPVVAVDTAVTVADTTAPAGVSESEFHFTRGEARLAGTLTMPRVSGGRVPVALIIAGSGPTDRNGNYIPVLATNMYAQIAWGLARHGIATVRYDKRGLGGSAMELDPYQLTTDVFMEDAAAGARALAADSRFSRVFLIGHSEGAQLAIQAANRGAPAAGVVMISGVGRPLPEVLREQVSGLLEGEDLARFDAALDQYLGGEQPQDVPAEVRPLLMPQNQRFLRSMAEYDAAAELRRAQVPVLIVHGERDIQVREADAHVLMAARPEAEVLMLPQANHVMKRTTATDAMGQLPTYRDIRLPIDPALVPGLVNWMRAQ